jgi:hypothetical protein
VSKKKMSLFAKKKFHLKEANTKRVAARAYQLGGDDWRKRRGKTHIICDKD